jgi:cytochrome c biogenesis protein CcmG, thiol:disulfide interchange protein DsbE
MVALLAALLLAACGATPAPAAVPPGLPPNVAIASRLLDAAGGVPQPGEVAPDFSYTGQDGSTRRLSELRGRAVLLNFWATWCVPCTEEMPALQRIAEEYGDRVTVVGVNKLETLDAIAPFARQIDVGFTLVPNPDGDISDRYAAKNIPVTYFINGDGTIGFVQLGVMTYEQAREQVERLE